VMQRTARDPRLQGNSVQRNIGGPFGGKGRTRYGKDARGGVLRLFSAGAVCS
jgi:hypothetical protein